MWLFFTIAVTLSLITFKADGEFQYIDNILNTTDLLYVGISTIAILVYGDSSTKFNRFDIACLIAVLVIFVFWIYTNNHFISNLAVQIILVIAYFPVISRMIKLRKNTESFSIWFGMLFVSAIALLSTKGLLAHIYVLRAVISIIILLALMIWIEIKNNDTDQNRSLTI